MCRQSGGKWAAEVSKWWLMNQAPKHELLRRVRSLESGKDFGFTGTTDSEGMGCCFEDRCVVRDEAADGA